MCGTASLASERSAAGTGGQMPSQQQGVALWGSAAFVLTLAAAQAGLQLQSNGIAQFWPAVGVIAGLLARAPRPLVPVVLFATLVALGIGNASQGRSIATSAIFMVGNLAEAAFVAWVLRRAGTAPAAMLSHAKPVSIFLMIAVAIAVISAAIAVPGLQLTGHADAPFGELWRTWFLSHASGLITVAPATLLMNRGVFAPRYRRDHAAMLGYVLVAAPLALFHEVMTAAPSVALGLVFVGPFVWWIGLATPAPRAAAATLLVAAAIIADVTWAEGFFVIGSSDGLVALLLLGSTLLLLGGTLSARAGARPVRANAGRAVGDPSAARPGPQAGSSSGRLVGPMPAAGDLLLFYSACVLCAGFAQSLGPIRETVVIWWPPNGLLLAMLLIHPRREWAWWIAVAALAELSASAIWFDIGVPLGLAYFAVNGSESVIGALLLERFFPRPVRVTGLRQVGMLVLVGAAAPMLAAVGGAAVNAATGRLDFAASWFKWWLGDTSGILIAAPIALVVAELWREHKNISLPRAGEAVAIGALLSLACGAAHWLDLTPYLVLPPLIWAAARFEFKGAVAGIAFLAVTTSMLETFGADAGGGLDDAHGAIAQQIFLLIVGLSALVTAALARRQQSVLMQLARLNADLERRVAQRTEALARREAEARDRADEIEAIYSAAPVGLAVLDRTLRYLRVNALLAEINGVPAADHIGRTVGEIVPDLEGNAAETVKQVLAGESVRGVEFTGTTSAQPGIVRTWLSNWLPLRDSSGAVVAVTLSAQDITERKQMERRRAFVLRLGEAIRGIAYPDEIMAAAAALLGREIGVAKVGFGETDDSGEFLIVRQDWGDGRIPPLLGQWRMDDFGPEFIRTLRAGEAVAIADVRLDRRTCAPEVLQAFAAINVRSVLNVGLLDDERMRAALFIHDPDPRRWTPEEIALVEATRDQLWSEVRRRRAELGLRESEARYRSLSERLDATVRERTAELRSANKKLRAEIKQRETAQSALVQSQKLEAIGQLTSGIAHDFNNVLASISGGFMLIGNLTQEDNIVEIAEHGTRAAQRGAAIVKQLLAFARRQTLEPKRVWLTVLKDEAEALLRYSIGPAVWLHLDIPEGLPALWIDLPQFETALINLAVNARDAMPAGGVLSIEARHCPPGASARPVELGDRDAVALCVRDTGCGMPPEVLQRVLEPFFTTKEVGSGTGLGLAMVYGFVQQSGGQLRIESLVGEGSAVTLFLPTAAERPAREPGSEGPEAVDMAGRRVLLVDDDDDARSIIEAQLRQHGMIVECARSGAEALRILGRDDEFDALLCDVVMPGMGGPALAAEIRRFLADLPILFITGRPDGNLPAGETVVTKPFAVERLLAALGGLLGRSAHAA